MFTPVEIIEKRLPFLRPRIVPRMYDNVPMLDRNARAVNHMGVKVVPASPNEAE